MSSKNKISSTAPGTGIAHAKINLALHVTGQRDDGYHLLDSLVCFTEFGDRLTIAAAKEKMPLITLGIKGPFAASLNAGIQSDPDDNLIIQAANSLAEAYEKSGQTCQNVQVVLEKNLPVASGIGGGSADAATILVMLQKFWNTDYGPNIQTIAGSLGADVPMCLDTRPKRVRGIGECISQFRLPVSLPILLVNPGVHLSTPKVFGALTKKDNLPITSENGFNRNSIDNQDDSDDVALIENVVETLLPLRNDLQYPAISLAPVIQNVLSSVEKQSGCLLARMSGSGATCFGIFKTLAQANDALTGIKEINPDWWSVVSKTIASS